MLDILKFVRAAIDKTGQHPGGAFFRIANATLSASNGHLSIQTPFPSDLDCCPNAEAFIKAVASCEGPIALHLEKSKLVVVSGRFKSAVPCIDPKNFRTKTPSGQRLPIPAPILPVLRKLFPFVANDEKRPWACGVHFVNHSAFATNSVVIVEHFLPVAFPVIATLPRDVVGELVRLKVEPDALQIDPHSVTFHLPGGAWVCCQSLNYNWPDIQEAFRAAGAFPGPWMAEAALESVLADVAKLEQFTDDFKAVYFHKGAIGTAPEGEDGTSLQNPSSPGVGIFRADQLAALRGIVDRIGFGAYPRAVPFYGGDHVRGVLTGYVDT